MELVSVIIPTHFRPDRVMNAVESVRNQTWSNLEIIVVSDGYDEETAEKINRIIERDNRITFISYNESKGGNYARNTGIKNASANYIAFLDDDDVWYPQKIEKQMTVINQDSKTGLVGCGINVKHVELGLEYKHIFRNKGDLSKDILYSNIIGSTSCALVRKEALHKCGCFDENLPARQDHDLWIRICQIYNVDFVESVQMDYYVYNSSGKSQQTSKSIEKYIQAHNIISEKYKELYDQLSPEEQVVLRARRLLGIAHRAVEVGEVWTAYRYAWKSWRAKKTKKALYFCLFSAIPNNFLIRVRVLKDRYDL